MNAHKCDRCHEFFIDNPEMKARTVLRSFGNMFVGAGVLLFERVDLCPACKQSFQKWFENPILDSEGKKVTRSDG